MASLLKISHFQSIYCYFKGRHFTTDVTNFLTLRPHTLKEYHIWWLLRELHYISMAFQAHLRAANTSPQPKKTRPKSAGAHFARSNNDLQKLLREIIIRNTSVEPGLCKALLCFSWHSRPCKSTLALTRTCQASEKTHHASFKTKDLSELWASAPNCER